MPGEEIFLVGAGGAVVAVSASAAPAPAHDPSKLVNGGVPVAPPVPGSPTGRGRRPMIIGGVRAIVSAKTYDPTMPPAQIVQAGSATNTGSTGGAQGDPLLQGKLDMIAAAAQKAYAALSDAQKQAGANTLNQGVGKPTPVKPDPPVSKDDTFDQVVTKVSAALGASAGAAVGATFGPVGGVVGGALGGILGAYLGQSLGPLLEKSWDDLKAYLTSVWGDITSGDLGGAVDATGKLIDQSASNVGDFFSSLSP